MSGSFEQDMDEIGTASVVESESIFENEDESDQAKASLFFVNLIEFILVFTDIVIVYLFYSIIWKAMRSTI